MRNIKLLIEYQGANYAGWQIQQNLPTVQGAIQEKIKIITGEDIKLTASSRTDAGVHALGQVANFQTQSRIPPHSIQMGLNALLPHDIVIKHTTDVSPDFDSRKDAKAKTYRYLILNRPYPSAIYRNFSWHVFRKLDIDAMKKAAGCLIGKKDFTSFRAAECDAPHSVREILSFSIDTNPPFSYFMENDAEKLPNFDKGWPVGLLQFEVKGTAFLRHMVRIMAGTLVAVGKGKIPVDQFQAVIDAKDRRLAGMTAPPHGLFLKEVEY